jgi:hypothetical protein
VTEGTVPKLAIGSVLRVVWRVYRRRWKILIPLAVIVLLPQSAADALVGEVEVDRVETFDDVLKLSEIPLALAINLAGEALYAGLVAAFVLEWIGSRPFGSLRAALGEIKFGSLILLDVLLALGTTLGLVLLIIPGVLFYAYTYVSPALIELNGLGVRVALRESFNLIRGSFWRVLAFAVIVLLVSETLTTALESPVHGGPGDLLYNLVIEAAIAPFVGLTTVFLALALLDLNGRERRFSAFVETSKRPQTAD